MLWWEECCGEGTYRAIFDQFPIVSQSRYASDLEEIRQRTVIARRLRWMFREADVEQPNVPIRGDKEGLDKEGADEGSSCSIKRVDQRLPSSSLLQ